MTKQAASDYMLSIETALKKAADTMEPEALLTVVAGTGTYFIEYALDMIESESERVDFMNNIITKIKESGVRCTLH